MAHTMTSMRGVSQAPAGDRVRFALRGERGFSLIELLIVMAIITILMAIVISSFRTPRRAVAEKAVRAAAASYQQGIDAFALDHSGRVPVPCPPSCGADGDWDQKLEFGPLDPLPGPDPSTPRRYMRGGAPEVVQGDLADFVVTPMSTGAALPATGRSGVIVYVPGSGSDITKYRLEVWTQDPETNGAKPKCWFGNLPPEGGGWPASTSEGETC